MHDQYNVMFDANKIIDHFGGVGNAIAALQSVRMTVKKKTIYKQLERGNMPADMVASLVLASSRIGNPIDILNCLLEREE